MPNWPPINPAHLTPAEMAQCDYAIKPAKVLFELTNHRCWYCGEPTEVLGKLMLKSPRLRHNKVPTCTSCSGKKHNLSFHQFREKLSQQTETPHKFWGELVGLDLPLAKHWKKGAK